MIKQQVNFRKYLTNVNRLIKVTFFPHYKRKHLSKSVYGNVVLKETIRGWGLTFWKIRNNTESGLDLFWLSKNRVFRHLQHTYTQPYTNIHIWFLIFVCSIIITMMIITMIVIHWEMCKTFEFDHTNKWYMQQSATVPGEWLLWDFDIQTDHLISARRPDLIVIIITSRPAEYRIKLKECKKKG